MPPENKMREALSKSSPRQKTIIAAVILVILIVVWQVFGMMKGSSPAPVMKPATVMSATSPDAAKTGSTQTVPEQASKGSHLLDEPRQATIINDSQFVKLQKVAEEKYVTKLNELEELKIQKQIAETNQAISAAKLATVSAEKDISNLLTKPVSGPIPQSVYSNQLAPASVTSEAAPKTPELTSDYSLISVSMQLNKWSAVLGYQGKLYSVTVGDVLQPDGSVVSLINKNSVILRKEDKRRKISITTSI